MAYSIGARSFDNLKGNVVLPKPHFDIESRSGEDGLTVFAGGVRGEPFELQSLWVDNSWAAAHATSLAYHSDPSMTPVNIIRGTVDYSTSDYQFIVLDVKVEIEPVVSWYGVHSGSLVAIAPAFLVKATWKIVAIDTTGSPGPGVGGGGGA